MNLKDDEILSLALGFSKELLKQIANSGASIFGFLETSTVNSKLGFSYNFTTLAWNLLHSKEWSKTDNKALSSVIPNGTWQQIPQRLDYLFRTLVPLTTLTQRLLNSIPNAQHHVSGYDANQAKAFVV